MTYTYPSSAAGEDCTEATQPVLSSISPASGPAGTTVTLTGNWPQAVPGADVKVFTWYNGSIYFNTVVDAITVDSFTTTSVTFQSPTWSTAIPDGAEVQFTLYVRPEGASSPQGGYPNTCVSSDGKGQGSFVQGMAMTYTYPSSAAGEDCTEATQPVLSSISPASGPAGTTVTLTGNWPQAVPGADVKVFTWYNGSIYFNTVVDAITVDSFTTTSVTFQSPTWSTAIPDGAEVQFTVYVRPEGASSPQGGYPNT